MNKIIVKSYIKVNEEYVDFFNYNGKVTDSDYIDGAVELTIHGIKLIDISMYDYIDDLWSYFSEGLASVYEEKDFTTFFPDQPIEVRFEVCRKNSDLIVSVNCHEEVSVAINRKEFIREMKLHAERFFEKLQDIVPDSLITFNVAKSYLDKIVYQK